MRKSKKDSKVADENESSRKPKGRRERFCNPFKTSKDAEYPDGKYDLPLVDYQPVANPDRTFVYDDGALEVSDTGVTSVSPRALKIFEAIREEEVELVLEELSNLQDTHEIDKKDGHGFALIHVAARYNFNRIVHTLLDYGADINIGTSQFKWTPLHLAARCVQIEMKSATVKLTCFEFNIRFLYMSLVDIYIRSRKKSKLVSLLCTLVNIKDQIADFRDLARGCFFLYKQTVIFRSKRRIFLF